MVCATCEDGVRVVVFVDKALVNSYTLHLDLDWADVSIEFCAPLVCRKCEESEITVPGSDRLQHRNLVFDYSTIES